MLVYHNLNAKEIIATDFLNINKIWNADPL